MYMQQLSMNKFFCNPTVQVIDSPVNLHFVINLTNWYAYISQIAQLL